MRADSDRAQARSPLILPLALVIIGGLLLLSNFYILENINLINLSPLLLVLLGTSLLLRGDWLPDQEFRPFGITRGSIESVTLDIDAGGIDVFIGALQTANSERLIAGQYARQSLPDLEVQDVHAVLRMQRSQTPLLSYVNWEMGLSRDLPWQILMSSHIGQVTIDLSHVIVQNGLIHTGIGDIHLTAPSELFETLYLRSIFGNIVITCPESYAVRVFVEAGRFFNVTIDESRYQQADDGSYHSQDHDEHSVPIDIVVSGTFGNAYLR